MIDWYTEAVREDSAPQLFDARVGHLHLRVVESEDGGRYTWGVSTNEHPPFRDDIDELSLSVGAHESIQGAKSAARRAVMAIVRGMERDL